MDPLQDCNEDKPKLIFEKRRKRPADQLLDEDAMDMFRKDLKEEEKSRPAQMQGGQPITGEDKTPPIELEVGRSPSGRPPSRRVEKVEMMTPTTSNSTSPEQGSRHAAPEGPPAALTAARLFRADLDQSLLSPVSLKSQSASSPRSCVMGDLQLDNEEEEDVTLEEFIAREEAKLR